MAQDDPAVYLWIITLNEERLHGMDEEYYELDHLELGQILLPPEVRLHLWTEGCQEVVEVHGNMDSAVQEPTKCGVTSANKFRTEPNGNWKPPMVNNMKGR